MKGPELIQLFPTPVLIMKYEKDYQNELNYIKKLEYKNRKESTEKGLNSQSIDSFLLDKPQLSEIRSFIEVCIEYFSKSVMGGSNDLIITQSWSNISSKGEHHHGHIHPNSIISGVFYFKINNLPPIQFKNPKKTQFGLGINEYNNFNSYSFILPANDGELILFPSDLEHSVPTNTSDENRISLSFNTFAKGNLGSIESLTYLPIERCL